MSFFLPTRVPCVSGAEAFALKEILGQQQSVLYVAENAQKAKSLASALAFVSPQTPTYVWPALGERVFSAMPIAQDILLKRAQVFGRLHTAKALQKTFVVITTPWVLLEKAPFSPWASALSSIKPGESTYDQLLTLLADRHFERHDVAIVPGTYAVRGGLIDVWPVCSAFPFRLDFFDQELEKILAIDPLTQRSKESHDSFSLMPLHAYGLQKGEKAWEEVSLPIDLSSLKARYTEDLAKGSVLQKDLPASVPLFAPLFKQAETLASWLEMPLVVLGHQVALGVQETLDQLTGLLRQALLSQGQDALMPDGLACLRDVLFANLSKGEGLERVFSVYALDGLVSDDSKARLLKLDRKLGVVWQSFLLGAGHQPSQRFEGKNFVEKIQALASGQRLCVLAPHDAGLKRWQNLLEEAKLPFARIGSFGAWQKLPLKKVGLALAHLPESLESTDGILLREEDFWPTALKSPRPQKKQKALALKELAVFEKGDYVTHEVYGVGCYEGLETLKVGEVVHDCLALRYEGGDVLYVPIENMGQVWRYGSAHMEVSLDRLTSSRWQAKKAKAKQKIQDMAEGLLRTAAERALKHVEVLAIEKSEAFRAFEKRFAYLETPDQQQAIEDTLKDLEADKPMDRLVCGDVGFGKTEVALRAAFAVVSAGKQVALVVPTTLLARQHMQHFQARFEGTGFKVAGLSRLLKASEVKRVKEDLANGRVDIVVATHAILSEDVRFYALGLLMVDEEQNFGVAQKEKLKKLKVDVHVLTLTATPIPRTLYMAFSDLKSLSLISTPPLGRKPVKTQLMPFSKHMLKEALEKEKERGGQSFLICPQIRYMSRLGDIMAEVLPDLRLGKAHGQMKPSDLEKVMSAFEDGDLDVLLATNIIGSGIDLSSAGTLVVYRADLFGLAALYQLRGRVGRSAQEGYAFLCYPEEKKLSDGSLKRLEVMKSLDYLGAGFQVASYDMDLRGAGNLVGAEQSGHMRDVGVSYYQKLLADTVAELKARKAGQVYVPKVETQVVYPESVCLPPQYIPSLGLRLGLYRRASSLETPEAIDDFEAELKDRFGAPIPNQAQNLLKVMHLKGHAARAFIEKIEIGPKGSLLSVAPGHPDPQKILDVLREGTFVCRLRPDQKIFFPKAATLDAHLVSLKAFLKKLACLPGFV